MKIQKLNSILIEDSPLHCKTLTKMVKRHPNLTLQGYCRNAFRAQQMITDLDIDLIFLNIEIPIINGFDFLETLEEVPQVIIVSDSDKYALKAYEYDVTDYLLNPICINRFEKAVKRALQNQKGSLCEQNDKHLFVKSNFRKVKVRCNEIKWIEALGDYVRLVTEKSNLVVQSSMKSFYEKLPNDQFVRTHKSYIVNLRRIERFNTTEIEVDGKKIPLSRKRRTVFMNTLGVE
ncbi:LytR/AlgR family response regulator transcription factor [Pareuzebyella sediminis]|uniref:LytR/AlgR family response regulator transcription factor n=1 Tax=Pareuzebyella sediminis TaxID=2607998 RepID=UPI0011ECC610|nr:LytTR family DNA-binding domain-containing protein [Pareuzebyella sediminis]